MMKKIYKIVLVLALVLVSVEVSAWNEPADPNAPNCPPNTPGCDAPINVSTNAQTKNGPLNILRSIFNAEVNSLKINNEPSVNVTTGLSESGAELGKYGQHKFYNFYDAGNALQAITGGTDAVSFYSSANAARSYGIKSISTFVGTFTRAKIGLVASNRAAHWGVTTLPANEVTTGGAIVTLIDNGSYAAYFDGPIKITGGNPGLNKVLVSDATGAASWVATSTIMGPTSTGGVTRLNQGLGIALTPNPITGIGSVAADTNYVQRRVAASCAVGSAIRSIAADGTVTCQSSASGSYGSVPGLPPTDTSEPCQAGSICYVEQTGSNPATGVPYRPAGLDSRIIMLKTKTDDNDTGIYEVFCPAGYVMIGLSYDGRNDDHVQNIYCSPLIAQ